jgi:hypothetical protein
MHGRADAPLGALAVLVGGEPKGRRRRRHQCDLSVVSLVTRNSTNVVDVSTPHHSGSRCQIDAVASPGVADNAPAAPQVRDVAARTDKWTPSTPAQRSSRSLQNGCVGDKGSRILRLGEGDGLADRRNELIPKLVHCRARRAPVHVRHADVQACKMLLARALTHLNRRTPPPYRPSSAILLA